MHEETENFEGEATGSQDDIRGYKTVVYPFDKYEITVKLSRDNEFIGILEVRVNKSFLSYKQQAISKGFHDVDEFYRE